jgi:hypothetical protein
MSIMQMFMKAVSHFRNLLMSNRIIDYLAQIQRATTPTHKHIHEHDVDTTLSSLTEQRRSAKKQYNVSCAAEHIFARDDSINFR